MLGASLYIIVCSARNRLHVRLRRLREPRYLLGGIAGVAYIYFGFFARMRSSSGSATGRRAPGASGMPAGLSMLAATGPAIVGVLLLGATALAWLVPVNSGLLDFSESEIQFLFPAPVSRRALLMHRLMRSQLGIVFGSVVVGLVTPSPFGVSRLRICVATWVLLTVSKVYFTVITLARTRLASRDPGARRAAWLPVAVNLAAVVVVTTALTRAFMDGPVTGARDALVRIGVPATSGLSGLVVWPFVAVARPLFAPWPGPFLAALGGAAIVLVSLVAWMLYSDDAFQDAAADAAERRAREPARQAATYRARWAGWTLATTGRPEVAFAWKAAMQTLRAVDRRGAARAAAILVSLAVVASSAGWSTGVAAVLGVLVTGGAMFAVLLAPQVLRMDMRQDLRHLEVLKTWPVKSAVVLRGELAWPGALITAVAWAMIGVATLLSAAVFTSAGLGMRLSVGVASAILAPALVFAQLIIHNGVALIFPAWVPLGNQRPRGLDAMGQRLIVLGATWLLLLVMVLPGALAGGIVWFAFRSVLGSAVLVPAATLCTVVVALEVLVAAEALGPAYERIDLMSVGRAE